MIIIGLILVLADAIFRIPAFAAVGIALMLVGAALMLLGATGHAVGGHAHYY